MSADFPGAGAARRIDDDLAVFSLEDLLQVFVERQSKLGEVGGAMILHDDVHGAQDAVRHIGRPWHKQKIAPWLSCSSHRLTPLILLGLTSVCPADFRAEKGVSVTLLSVATPFRR